MRGWLVLACFVVAALLLAVPLFYAVSAWNDPIGLPGELELLGIRVDLTWPWFLAGSLAAMVVGAVVSLRSPHRRSR